MKYRLVIWGTGAVYNRHVNLLKYYELKNEIEIIAVTVSYTHLTLPTKLEV